MGTGRLLTTAAAGGDHAFLYDSAGNVRKDTLAGSTGDPAQSMVSYYDASDRLRAVEKRWLADGGAFLGPRKILTMEEYRYDALGRRILVRTQRTCTGISFTVDNPLECKIGMVRRTLWDGAQELAEIQMPDSAAYRESDTDPVSLPRLNPEGDPNPYYGRIIYAYGLQVDQPISVARFGYADFPSGGTVTQWAPFVILPFWNSRGQAPFGAFSDGNAVHQLQGPPPCQFNPPSIPQRCVIGAWPGGWAAFDQLKGLPPMSWHGTLLENKRDKSGLEYRRNRVYDPSAARFTQEDPIGLAGGLNAYGFAGGDPVNFSDPFGLCPWHDIECWEDKMWAASGGTGVAGRVLAPLASTILEATGLSSVDAHAKEAARGSRVGGALLALDIGLAAIPGGEEGGRALAKVAEGLASGAGRNTVSIHLAEGAIMRVDLVGRAHGGVEVPHIQFYRLHTNPETGVSRLSRDVFRAATMEDLRMVRRFLGRLP